MAEGKKFVSDDEQSTVAGPVTPEGGTDKVVDKKNNDEKLKKVTKKESEEIDGDGEYVVEESIQNMFEGMDLSEDFKKKVSVVFEAALHEQVSIETQKIEESLREELQTDLQEQIDIKIDTIVEDLDSYLGYVVDEWMKENEIAIESGIKVDMAESLMGGLKNLFSEHNIDIDESTLDVVTDLEEEVNSLSQKSNKVIGENIRLSEEIASLKAEKVFDELTESLTVSQRERLKILSENLNYSDIEEYSSNLTTLKESFFSEKNSVKKVVDEEAAIITEDTEFKRPASDHGSINALVEALNRKKKQ
jgi:hypothetical protein